ncbi:MAG: Carbohydrate family 9 binding domain-like [Clostridia bacterium]|nr:Carbohydrate family 9 binding domain-like [Clostridia bacterium]
MIKKISFFIAVLFITVQMTITFSAAEIQVYKSVPNLDGIISENEWPADGKYLLNKTVVDNYNGCWAGAMTDDMQATYYFLWSDEGLYTAVDIKDSTVRNAESWDVHGADVGPAADGFQFNLYAHDLARWLTIGSFANGDLAPRTHYGDVSDLTGIVKGKAVRTADSYVIEALIPWATIDAGHDIKEGEKIPLLFTYMDRFDGGENCYKTMDAAAWPPLDTIDNSLVLGKEYIPPVAEEAVEEVVDDSNPDTSDFTFIAYFLAASVLVIGIFAFMLKRREQ